MLDNLEFFEPEGLIDLFCEGVAKIEPVAGGLLVRVWLYSEECLNSRMRIIKAKIVLPLDAALEANGAAGKAYRQIHREVNPLKVVS